MRKAKKAEKQKKDNKKLKNFKEPNYNNLNKVKEQLRKQQENRKKQMLAHDQNERYKEIIDGLNAPETPQLEQSAAHEAYRNAYWSTFKRVVEKSDVLLEVLDARDPMGCRSQKLENYILQRGKRLVLVLNKADLVPVEVLNKWLTFLRREFPTMPFKASAHPEQQIQVPLHDGKWRSSDVYGLEELKNLLNKFAAGANIVAGVIGPPNSGKSSIINSLSRRDAAGVGATPGFTKTMKEVAVTSRIQILDCPGVVPFSGGEITPSMVLRNSIKVELLDDPLTPIDAILSKVPKENILSVYKVESYSDANDFLSQLARIRGKLLKGGVEDIKGMARIVLDDWNHGRIKYFTIPPSIDDAVVTGTYLVTNDGTEYQIGKVIDYDQDAYKNFQIQHVFEVIPRGNKETNSNGHQDDDDIIKDDECEDIFERQATYISKMNLNDDQRACLDNIALNLANVTFEDL